MRRDIERENDLILFGMIKGATFLIRRLREETLPGTKFKLMNDIAKSNDTNAKKAALVFAQETFYELQDLLKSISREDAIDNEIEDLRPVVNEIKRLREVLMASAIYPGNPNKKSFH